MKSLYSKANIGSHRLDTILKMNQVQNTAPIEVAIDHANNQANRYAIPTPNPLVTTEDENQQDGFFCLSGYIEMTIILTKLETKEQDRNETITKKSGRL